MLVLGLGMVAFLSNGLRLLSVEIGNADVSGILYNADLINQGGLPYRDSLEHKSPLSFFMTAAVFASLGRDLWVLNLVFYIWLCFGALAVGTAAATLYASNGGRSGKTAGFVAAGVFLLSASQFEYNYSAWMTPAYTASFALALLAARHGRLTTWLLSGVAFTFACLLKAFAITLAPVIVLIWWRMSRAGVDRRGLLVWVAGAVLGLVPLVGLYAWNGALEDLIFGSIPIDHAVRYATATILPLPWWDFLLQVLWQAYETFPLAVALAGVACLVWWFSPAKRAPLGIAVAFLVVSLIGVSLGGTRFYRHYLIQYLPALAMLVAYPRLWSWLSLVLARSTLRHQALATVVAVAMMPQLLHIVLAQPLGFQVNERQTTAKAAAEYVREFTSPEHTILAWGWDAWPVYYWAERTAPGAVYKELGAVTTLNNNSSFFAGETPRFRDAETAHQLLAELVSDPPQAVVIGGFYGKPTLAQPYPGPLEEFAALREFLDQNYRRDRLFGDLLVLRLNQFAQADADEAPIEASDCSVLPENESKPLLNAR